MFAGVNCSKKGAAVAKLSAVAGVRAGLSSRVALVSAPPGVMNPEGRTVTVAATVPGELLDQLDALAERNWSRSRAVTEAIRGLLAAQKRR